MRVSAQEYPRIREKTNAYYDCLDDTELVDHKHRITEGELADIVAKSLDYANKKTSVEFFEIPTDPTLVTETEHAYQKGGKKLFEYFRKYCGDPAVTALQCSMKHYSVVAKEQFRNVTLQMLRMNSGWRYQFIAKETACLTQRFAQISDIGTTEADFNTRIATKHSKKMIYIYVSVKNRTNTMGGQDWPKAIQALEMVAHGDKNRDGPYLCVFGIAMERGIRSVRKRRDNKQPYSHNTEIWLSDFFWPFFSSCTYEEIVKAVLTVLIDQGQKEKLDVEVPEGLIHAFGECCKKHALLDSAGKFSDLFRLVDFFVKKSQGKTTRRRRGSE